MVSISSFEKSLKTGLFGPFVLAKLAAPYLSKAANKGRIINVASTRAHMSEPLVFLVVCEGVEDFEGTVEGDVFGGGEEERHSRQAVARTAVIYPLSVLSKSVFRRVQISNSPLRHLSVDSRPQIAIATPLISQNSKTLQSLGAHNPSSSEKGFNSRKVACTSTSARSGTFPSLRAAMRLRDLKRT
jgi:NAD(P)-dependent dehydrogenase (short-subunit alcohol dehydrogenase family)